MGTILRNTYAYWQYVLKSDNPLLKECLKINIQLVRNNNISYYTRIKNLLHVLNIKKEIYEVQDKQVKNTQTTSVLYFIKLMKNTFFKKINQLISSGSEEL